MSEEGGPTRREVNEELLEGHLMVTRDLVAFLSAEKKFQIGCRADGTPNSHELLKVWVELNLLYLLL